MDNELVSSTINNCYGLLLDVSGLSDYTSPKSCKKFVAVGFVGTSGFHISCPCGKSVYIDMGNLPETDTKFPCDKPDHWIVKYDVDASTYQ